MPEARAEPVAERLVERLLARMPERRVPRVVAEPDRLDQILVQPERSRDDARDRRRLERVRHASPVVVAFRVDEDLGLPLQPAKRLRVDDPVAVALERRSHAARLLGPHAPLRLVRADGERGQPRLLALADKELEVPRRTIERLHRHQSNPRRGVRLVRREGCGRQNERDWPPSTVTQVPTTHDARSETRNATTSAISSTVPKRPNGSSRSTNAAIPSGSSR